MTGLYEVSAYLQGPWLLGALTGMGLGVGILTGLFGVGGAFVIVPLMSVLLGIDYTVGVGCSMCFTIGTSSAGWSRHMALGNVALKSMLILGGAAVCGTMIGADIHSQMRAGLGKDGFTMAMDIAFLAVLIATGWLIYKWSPQEKLGRSLLQRLPLGPKIDIVRAGLTDISLPGLCAVGLVIGVLKGVLGIGGGVLFMPLMLLVVGLTLKHSVGTSLGVVMLSSVAGTIIYGASGQISLWIVMPLLIGSSLGVQLGAYLCTKLKVQRIQKYFVLFILLVILVLAGNLAHSGYRKLSAMALGQGDAPVPKLSSSENQMNGLFRHELSLPARGVSQRVTRKETIRPGQSLVLFDESGPGCLMHWWLTYMGPKQPGRLDTVHRLRLKVYYDGQDAPAIDMTMGQFFAQLLDQPIYMVRSAAIAVLPRNALNCYFPMPFQRMRMELVSEEDQAVPIWFMGDWQAYGDKKDLTPLRLHAVHRQAFPAEPAGSFLMADFAGQGFIAGMVKAVRARDTSDAWYHNGGDLWLLDGESSPHALRGIGGEDVFNMSFGIYDYQDQWVGAPFIQRTAKDNELGSGYCGVMYRIFGPCPIWFDRSAVVRFGSKANDIESVIYAYLAAATPATAPAPLTVSQWRCAGPMECLTFEQFQTKQWADGPESAWPKQVTADFGQYLTEKGPASFAVPIAQDSLHTWCDLAQLYRGRQKTNGGTQPCDVSAVSAGTLHVEKAGRYRLHVGFDDWLTLWVGGVQAFQGRHDHGFAVATVECDLPAGDVNIRVKLANKDNFQWRLWTFSFRAELL